MEDAADNRILATLDSEWRDLADQAHPWPDVGFVGDTYRALLSSIRTDPDGVLGQLIALHQQGQPQAGRVVLQAFIGKLIRSSATDPQQPLAVYLGEFWCRLSDYPLTRRPRSIAANLVLDTRKAVIGSAPRQLAVDPKVLESLAAPVPDLSVNRVVAAGIRLGLIDEDAAAALRAVYGLGLLSHEAAVTLDTTATAVRWRNARTIGRLTRHASMVMAVA